MEKERIAVRRRESYRKKRNTLIALSRIYHQRYFTFIYKDKINVFITKDILHSFIKYKDKINVYIVYIEAGQNTIYHFNQ